MSGSSLSECARIVRALNGHYGYIPWWPGDTDEVLIGAVLTQQTRWENVVRALALLKERSFCTVGALSDADPGEIENAIRCTGFYRVKTRRLKALATFVMTEYGGIGMMARCPTHVLREGLLQVPGIGEETADSILCYGFHRTSFVIDAYTHKICGCANIPEQKSQLKDLFEEVLPPDNEAYRQTHAHIVEYAKEYCGKKRCETCLLMNSKE
jgi:endonuclease III related protein